MDQNMQNFAQNRGTIVPITFVNGNIKATEELNSMFTLPYDIAVLSRASTIDGIRGIADSGNVSESALKSFTLDVARMNKNNHEDAIKVYLLMNCREFIYAFLNNMMNKICDLKIRNSRYDDEDDYDGYYYNYIDDRAIDKLVFDQLNTFVFAMSTNRDMTAVYYYQLMNSLYFQVVAYLDGAIRNMVFRRFTNGSDKSFKKLVSKVYGENNGIDPSTFTPEFRYTFATSIIREMAEKELPELYGGLNQIFMTAASMAYMENNPVSREEIFGAQQPQITNEHHECNCGGNCTCETQPVLDPVGVPPTKAGFGRKRK